MVRYLVCTTITVGDTFGFSFYQCLWALTKQQYGWHGGRHCGRQQKNSYMELDMVADVGVEDVADKKRKEKVADMDCQSRTGGCKDHLLCLYLLTTPTSKRYIRKLFVWASAFPPCRFWPLSCPMDFNFNLHAILSLYPPLVVNWNLDGIEGAEIDLQGKFGTRSQPERGSEKYLLFSHKQTFLLGNKDNQHKNFSQ